VVFTKSANDVSAFRFATDFRVEFTICSSIISYPLVKAATELYKLMQFTLCAAVVDSFCR